jgi:acyl carrier protein
MSTIEQEVREFLRDTLFIPDADGLSDDDSFLELGILDSMGILHLIAFVEEKYGIHAEDSELVTDNWDSVSRMSRYIRSKSGVAAPKPVEEPPAVPSPYPWAA